MRRLTIATLFVAACAHSAGAAATFDQVKRSFQSSDTLILDRQGELLHRLRTDATVRRGRWVALADISPALRTALVLSEDKRFYEHSGVDWQAVSSAAWANVWNTRTRGASTITMQLAGLLDDDLKRSAGGRSVAQKLGQTVSATVLERSWRKDQILEAYLNLVPLRGELVGVDALSRTLFGKAPHGLDLREAAVTAALVRSPNAKVEQVAQRACRVLRQVAVPVPVPEMAASPPKTTPQGDCDALEVFASAALQRRDYAASEGVAPHLARYALQRGSVPAAQTSTLTTTLRAPLQRFAVQTLQQHLRELAGRNVDDGAVLVLDNASGEVLAWVGSSGELSGAAEVDGVLALRQPGSTLKPFLYAQAIAQRRLTAASLIEDTGTQILTQGGLYIPQNYDRQFKGWVSIRTALAASLNVPAVRTLVMVSPDAFHKQLIKFGMPLKETGDFYGYSLALGSAEVSLLNLTNAYRALGRGGRFSPPTLVLPLKGIETTTTPKVAATVSTTLAIDPAAAFIVGDILSDPLARARTFGPGSVLSTRFWTAVKTGTSKDMRDNWAIGWSERYTVGVWVGNASGASMWDVSGTTGAAPVWAAVMNFLHQSQASASPRPPVGMVQTLVQFGADAAVGSASSRQTSPIEAARKEWFLAGTQQAIFAMDLVAANAGISGAGGQFGTKYGKVLDTERPARITAPASGTTIALDPDIPPRNQRLRLSAEGKDLHWRIDGKLFAKGPVAFWPPWPGKHRMQITDASGKVLDEVRLEVRGAGVR